MKNHFIFLVFAAFIFMGQVVSIADSPKQWIRFQDEKSDLYGYKDGDGQTKIPAKFIMADAERFHNIIAVIESSDQDSPTGYYLLKNGRKIGINDLYMSGNYFDCESEGKIRFRDNKTGLVGFFDKTGKYVIPAVYSDAEPFRNNMAMVLKGAKRICPDGSEYSSGTGNCEHPRWQGGKSYLIDGENNVLIYDFKHTRDLNWFSVKLWDIKRDDPVRDSFKGANGRYYSFVNYAKEFAHWLESEFFLTRNTERLKPRLFEQVICRVDEGGWENLDRQEFLRTQSRPLLEWITRLNQKRDSYQIYDNPVGIMVLSVEDKARLKKYFNSCGRPKSWQYPAFDVEVSHPAKEGDTRVMYQARLSFLRTDDGFQLTSLSLGD